MAKGRKTGGRKKGVRNKATGEIKAICRQYGPAMVRALVRIATASTSPQARVAAIKEILDRGYGKTAQPITGEDGGPIEVEFTFALDNASSNQDD